MNLLDALKLSQNFNKEPNRILIIADRLYVVDWFT